MHCWIPLLTLPLKLMRGLCALQAMAGMYAVKMRCQHICAFCQPLAQHQLFSALDMTHRASGKDIDATRLMVGNQDVPTLVNCVDISLSAVGDWGADRAGVWIICWLLVYVLLHSRMTQSTLTKRQISQAQGRGRCQLTF